MLARLFTRLIDAQGVWTRPLGDFNHRVLAAIYGPIRPLKDFLNGKWLGHPVHGAMTDLPIGIFCWVIVLDLLNLHSHEPPSPRSPSSAGLGCCHCWSRRWASP